MVGFTIDDFVSIETSEMPSFDSASDRVDGRLAFRSNRSGVFQLWLTNIDGSEPHQLTDTGGVIYGVAFRPGHDEILYIADDGGDEQFQLHLLDVKGGTSRPLASAPRVIHNFGGWSPDGYLISYVSNRRDRSAFDLYVLDVDTGVERLMAQHDGMLEAGRFSPDSRYLLFRRLNLEYPGDLVLLLADLEDATADPVVLTPHDDLSEWLDAYIHPSGAILALADDGRDFAGLQRIDRDTLEREFLLVGDWGMEAIALASDGSRIAVVWNEDGYSRIEAYEVTSDARLGARLDLPALPRGVIEHATWRPDAGALACTIESPRHIPDVWMPEVGASEPRRITSGDARGLSPATLPEPETIRYPSFDGREIPAFLYLPEHPATDGPLPCLVLVHGGPEMQSRPPLWGRYSAPHYLLAKGDVALLVPNVRGSTGYGKEYAHADDVEKRMDSVADLNAALDWLAASGRVDPDRIGVMGGSYGGFMVLAAITEAPERWAAAIDLFGIANFETFLEHTGAWRRKHRSREYGEDPEFLRSISPIHKADEIRAPLLVFQGDHDVRVPPEESEQIVQTVLRNEGIVEYVVYPEEGHGFQKLPHRLDLAERVVGFVERHLVQRE
jgi:dipeptidyl aminopeptidase/acylaminoacyl peptidase